MNISGMDLVKGAISSLVGMVGFWMLMRGKKTQDTSLMIKGGVLLVLSTWMFW
jgi:hypothetical protein